MPSHIPPPSFSFHIDGDTVEGHSVPVPVLIQILENAQRAFELIGVHVEGRGIKARARVSAATSRRFQLVCQASQAGSYVLPVTIGGSGELFSPDLSHRAFEIFRDVMKGISAHASADLSRLLPDARILRRVMEAAKGMAPRADAQWTLSLCDSYESVFATFDLETIPFIEETLVPVEQREAARVVTGELKSIDFTERKITIIYPPTNKELACIYEDAVEDLLYEKRRDLIQVTGRVLLDDQGEPRQIIDVTDIRDLDLSALVFDTVRHAGVTLKSIGTLSFEPILDESKQLQCIEQPELGIDVYAPTRGALLAELQEQIVMLWKEYALANDADLDTPARTLKQALLARFNEVTYAP